MVLRAIAAPTETEMPPVPPSAAASEAAPASDVMEEVSLAESVTASATMPVVPVARSPSI